VGSCGFVDLSGNLGLDQWSRNGTVDGSPVTILRSLASVASPRAVARHVLSWSS
jgi:hypothetical protein